MFNFSKKLSLDRYKQIVEDVPILCVDALIVHEGQYLLVRRNNEPLKGEWWVPGGRVYKGETMEQALRRKVQEEVGLPVRSLAPLGYYEEHFEKNAQGSGTGIHTMSVVFLASPFHTRVRLDAQSSDWRFSDELPKKLIIRYF